ncbi:MAG TPA: outer membrane beta-barrel protein, partial [Candidatus Avalokitesvara rifleensis]|uniref:outer membrane beta-barrel protein n=1 Tax=Candidatus Avalokitesvara rifleensis TaxID=3367620 RepID=UPI0040294B7F
MTLDREGRVLSKKLVSACIFVFGTFLCTPPQIVAAELTDDEIAGFRQLLEENVTPRTTAAADSNKEITALRGLLDRFKGITFGGYIENYYQYESVNPPAGDSVAIPPIVYTRQVSSFTVGDIVLWLYKETPNPGDVGFKITLNWGEMARRLTTVRPVYDDGLVSQPMATAPVPGRTGGRQATFREAYAQWNIPVGRGITARFGKFSNWIGYEQWDSIRNPNVSLSYVFGWGVPGIATGLGLDYNATDRLALGYYFVNTAGTFVNNNKGYTHGTRLRYSFPDFSFFKKAYVELDGLWGPQNALNNSEWSQVYDTTLSFSPSDRLTLVTTGNLNHGSARIVQPSGRATDDNSTWGVSQYLIYNHTDSLGFAVRGEYFWDEENAAGISGGDGASLTEVTGTLNLR